MALTNAELDARIDALVVAIASGVTEVQYQQGKRVRYRSLSDMKEALGMLQDLRFGGGRGAIFEQARFARSAEGTPVPDLES